jgi:hypothetical protein
MIIDSLTGKNANDNNHLGYNIKYNSGLNNPSVKFKMYRRSYEHIDDTNYILVDAKDYFDNVFTNGTTQKEYTLINNPSENNTFIFTFKNNLITGTYKMEFILYDGSSAIGSVEKYIIIK